VPRKYLVIIAGPTGVGKTGTSIQLARYFNTEIVNADSRQVYREMKIGTASPAEKQLIEARHHLVGHKSIHDTYHASMFEEDAITVLKQLFTHNNMVIMTGGSGMYIRAVCEGIDDLPSTDPAVRLQLRQEFETIGLEGIRKKLMESDPAYYQVVDLNNPGRILKALEIFKMTGKTYSSFLTGKAKEREFIPVMIGLDLPREELHRRINQRVHQMFDDGLEEEARTLFPFHGLNALNTVGYKELFDFFENKCLKNEAIEQIKGHTRQYARRQVTWFRNQAKATWFLPEDIEGITSFIKLIINE
jgi:tRNA dimethylallyltransferase